VAYINAAEAGQFVTLHISTATIASTATTGNIVVSGLQNITINNGNSVFRWRTLESTSENAVATPATNQLAMNIVIEPTDYFGDGAGEFTAEDKCLFKLSNDKNKVYFRLYYSGAASGDRFVSGAGYFTGLSPTVSPDSPVWVSPLTIEVDGDLTPGTV
jgi:regulatory protein YycH of two-component signal transduction system YycFG